MISYVLPYDTGKDLCSAYNRECDRLRNQKDWVVFVDADAMFLSNDFGHQVESIINANPDARIFTATTNRIGTEYQKVPAGVACGDNIAKHRTVAKVLWEQHGSQLVDITDEQLMSGFFIAIRKDLWKRIRGFDYWYPTNDKRRGMLGIDNMLHKKVAMHEKVYMAKGLYLYHWYRGGDMRNTKHLLK